VFRIQQRIQIIKAKLRPGFHQLAFRFKLFNGNKLNLRDDLFILLHFFRRAKQNMHNAKMDAPDFGGIVIDQANGFCVECALNRKFFANFPLDSFLKRLQADCKERMIFVIDVAADAD